MDVTTHEIVGFSTTSNPGKLWLENVARSIFSGDEVLPKVIVSDRDGIYGEWLGTFLNECYGLKLFRTPPRCPNCNAFIERWHRSIRVEMLDHTLLFGKRDLQRLVAEYLNYYHYFHPHHSLDQDSPRQKHDTAVETCRKIKRTKMVDGLVANFQLAA